ncbi:hypothetical protein ALC56_15011 [Trachymyrmex septentrionalis]|uniref:Uncharacterized protein n=1 Tax=Trachymyrmex septentrionalis TaxID=34720 RepID=A0A151JSV9_9HYME|nr:hypothetical protein ALC56_15011 [Trachymyrmex septentrionalis]
MSALAVSWFAVRSEICSHSDHTSPILIITPPLFQFTCNDLNEARVLVHIYKTYKLETRTSSTTNRIFAT